MGTWLTVAKAAEESPLTLDYFNHGSCFRKEGPEKDGNHTERTKTRNPCEFSGLKIAQSLHNFQ